MRRGRCIVLACILAPLRALADGGCVDVLTTAPAHPGAADVIALRGSLAAPPGRAVLARARAAAAGTIELEVVITDAPQAFAGYRRVGDAAVDAMALVGPLAAGSYVVATTTRRFAAGRESRCPVLRTDLVVADTAAPVGRVEVIEYYDATLGRHFMTADAREIAELDAATSPWSRTGRGFEAYALYGSDNRAEAVCRYARVGGTVQEGYVLSASYAECAALAASASWRYDARAFDIVLPDTLTGECPRDTRSVYRVWSAQDGDHRWTTDAIPRASLLAHGWVPEGYGNLGVAMCAPTP